MNQEIMLDTPVGDIVKENALTAAVFFKNGIDFCCGGGVSLEKACSEKCINADQMLNQLAAFSSEEPEFKTTGATTPREVIEYILERFHDTHREEIPMISFLIEKVTRVHSGVHPWLIDLKKEVESLCKELEPHMLKEEQVLFPLILQSRENAGINQGDFNLQNPIRQMEFEHDNVGNTIKSIQKITEEFVAPEGACNSFRALYAALEKFCFDLFLHIHLENNVLHPMVNKKST